MVELDSPAQQLLITSLRTQINLWQQYCDENKLDEEEHVDIQNDIGYAHSVLSELESNFFKEFGYSAE